MNRPRIGMFLKNDDPGSGPGRYVRSLERAIDPDEFEVVRLAEPARTPRSAISGRSRSLSKAAWGLAPYGVRYCVGFEREVQRLTDLFRSRRVDVLHTNETGCEESAVAARLAAVPAVVGTLHVLPGVDVARRRQRAIHRRLERRAVCSLDLGIAVSEAGRAAWMQRTGFPASRLVTIHNGIDTEHFRRRGSREEAQRRLDIPVGDVVVGTVARLSKVKGLEHLIRAAAGLRRQGVRIRIVIAGTGELIEELRGLAAGLEIAAFVHFLGQISDVRAALQAFDVFALPSLSEALPYALLEAMGMELPIVASDVGGIPEVVSASETGILVPPGNADSLSAGLSQLISSGDLRVRMGRAGRSRVIERFDERRMAQQTIGVYRRLLMGARACA